MALPVLCPLDRLQLTVSASANTDQRTLDALNYSVSDAIRKYCRRDFTLRNYDELYNGNGNRELLLRAYPLQEVRSVRYRPVTVLKIINNTPANIQQARVLVTKTGIVLQAVDSGSLTVSPFLYSSYATLTAMATAITALGNGWSAQVQGGDGANDYTNWPSQDLYVAPSFGDGIESQGALTARNCYAELKMHTYELQGYQWDPRGWLLRAIPYTDPELLHPEDLIWPIGINNFRIQYTAGYQEIPPAVVEACAEWVSFLWYLTQRDPALQHFVPGSNTANTQGWGSVVSRAGQPPDHVKTLLAPYRRFVVAPW